MSRLLRSDVPGAIFHVVNRGVAKRTILEGRPEFRFFLSLVARGVRKGWIRVHAYSLMTNHYHLLVTSEGHLSTFMQWAMSRFVRRFNRRRERDGPLFRARFWARRVHCEADFRNVVRYIDHNPVAAGLVGDAQAYSFGSAWHYVREQARPRWLHRAEVLRLVGEAEYRHRFPPACESLSWWIERRIEAGDDGRDPFAQLLASGANVEPIVKWLRDQAIRDDRRKQRPPLVSLPALLAAIEHSADGALDHLRSGRQGDPWEALRCGLVRTACGASLPEIAEFLSLSVATVRRRCARHATLLRQPSPYAHRAGAIVARALSEVM